MADTHSHSDRYDKNSLSLFATVSMGIGVMIGAGLFALTGQLAEHAGSLFPFAFLSAAVVAGFSAYSYIKVCRVYPSAGGVAMILQKCYGPGIVTAGCSLLMYFSMVINESLVARTFGTYTLQLFDVGGRDWLVPVLGVGLLILAFLINLPGNAVVGNLSKLTAIVKVLGVAAFAGAGLWVSGGTFQAAHSTEEASAAGFLAATAIGVLAYKGFTTITNSGDEVTEPKKNIGRAIMISLLICVALYLLVGFAVASGLSVEEVIKAKDYALAEAARPVLGRWGVWFTVGIAIIATVSGVIASVFAVSRMLAMLTEMDLVPHRHFGMPGRVQKHTLVYTIILAIILTIFLDLSRIAAIGAIFYIIMDMAVHWGVLRHLRSEVHASIWVLVPALILDAVVLTALCMVKATTDPLVLIVSGIGIALIFSGEFWFIRKKG